METDQEHPIRVVARRTGLTPHVIRVWEKRYGAVTPKRTGTNRRFYTDADIERLILLRRATQAGRSIGQVARMATERLENLVRTDEAATRQARAIVSVSTNGDSPETILDECLAAVKELDAAGLEASFSHAVVRLSRPVFFEQVVSPLMSRIGDLWKDGTFCVAHEHLASALVRTMLGSFGSVYDIPLSAPCLVVATPSGQLHEFGALLVAATAVTEGWRVTYLGPNLPGEEIARAVRQNQARAVALSLLYPADDSRISAELQKLRRCIGDDVAILTGGRASEAYSSVLTEIHAVRLDKLTELQKQLEVLRNH